MSRLPIFTDNLETLRGRELERAAVVAWLRGKAAKMDAAIARSPENRFAPAADELRAIYQQNADAISRGDHLAALKDEG